MVHESDRTRITRVFLPTGTVIRKEPLGLDAPQRLRREVAVLERLRGIAGIAQLLQAPQYADSIVLADGGDRTLASRPAPLPTRDLIELAVQLARAVAGMHGRGVIHRDIAPENVVIRDGSPCLVDFAVASSFAEVRPEFTHHSAILGTLAYVAPEQTGRTARPVDQRADLYALGATLYELATGEPPFGSGDALRLIHDHLARVPAPPAARNRAVPAPLSEIIMHLLEKEPDNRYQTADGLLHDLERLRDAGAPRVGERDFSERLLPPSRLVGRDAELAALRAAFEHAMAGGCRGMLVGGSAGAGKTALIDQLRPVVTHSDGWFVSGKFDQYRRDLEFDARHQAFRALGRLLLAEPEAELRRLRDGMLGAVGANAGLLTAAVPEFAALLATPPDPGDPLTAQIRVQRASVEALRAVASPTRPLVLFIDDLQWAGRASLGFVDLVLSDEPVDGLLLVCAYRDDDVDATHPLAAPLARWREQAGVEHLELANLPSASLGALVGEMLHTEPDAAAQLVTLIEPHTHGNPYETVELLNALRRDQLLTATDAGWRWDQAAVGAHLGRSELDGLLAARVDAMAAQPRQIVEAMACLGGRAERRTLAVATALPDSEVDRALAPAVEDGVLVLEPGRHDAVRFRHDRIREAVLGQVDAERRRALQLAMARRMASVPELFAVAAEHYLPVVDAIDDPRERRQVVELLLQAAEQAALTGDYGRVNSLLSGTPKLIDADDRHTLVSVRMKRHSALFSLGRLEEADDEYRAITDLRPGDAARAAAMVQVRSLTYRNRFSEATELGLRSLHGCGITVPAPERLPGEIDDAFETVYRWLQDSEAADDLARPDITDPALIAAGGLFNGTMAAVYLNGDHALLGWLSLEALRVWIRHGPGRTLVGPACHFAHSAIELRGDYAAGYHALRRLLIVSEARGYEPNTSQALHVFNASARFWFEPIENLVPDAQRAREGLIAGGDLPNAGYSFPASTPGLLESAPSLDACGAQVEAGLAFLRRTGGEQIAQWLDSYGWLVDALRGERRGEADEVAPEDKYADNPLALFFAHITRAIAAAIFDDPRELERHTRAAMALVPAVSGHYATAWARLLRGLAVAGQARDAADDEERDRLLGELDDVTRWLAARAEDAPENFRHLVLLLEAERAWTVADFRASCVAFDAARREVMRRSRPWHGALIAERAARFSLAHGLSHAGEQLLAQARQQYLAWGASAKVDQLDWAHPILREQPDPATREEHRSSVTTGTVDLLGILSASQTLSSETSVERLQSRVIDVLGAMTGATHVQLLLWSEDRQAWLAPATDGAAPMTVLRYAQRVREPLVVSDATTDDRFARDPYFAALGFCSLLSVPILSRGTLQAVLLLENRLIRGAFSAERLDAVKLIAGQLAVSLDNAHLYAEFRRIADEQAALRRVATLVAQGAAPGVVFDAVAAEMDALLDADEVSLGRFGPGGELLVLASRGSAAPPASELRSRASAPVTVDGRSWGSITASWEDEHPPPADTEERMVRFAELLETAIANADSRDQLTASRTRLLTEADEARRRVVHDLHDGAQQLLVATTVTLGLAQQALGGQSAEAESLVARALDYADQANTELRELAHGILPWGLSHGGLQVGVDMVVQRLELPVERDIVAKRFPAEIEASAYFVVAEALTNVVKHSRATRAAVRVYEHDRLLHVEVRDDGIGGADPNGHGLIGMRDRVTAHGGALKVESPVGGGTLVMATLPIPVEADTDLPPLSTSM